MQMALVTTDLHEDVSQSGSVCYLKASLKRDRENERLTLPTTTVPRGWKGGVGVSQCCNENGIRVII